MVYIQQPPGLYLAHAWSLQSATPALIHTESSGELYSRIGELRATVGTGADRMQTLNVMEKKRVMRMYLLRWHAQPVE